MILSYKSNFLFVKTRKTGGTSLEIALSEYCGPDDIITPISKPDEKIRKDLGYYGRQHYKKPIKECSAKELAIKFIKGIDAKKFYNHISAAEIKDQIDNETWNKVFKFTIDRNPWDKTISRYYWKNTPANKEETLKGFEEFILSGKFAEGSDFYKYSLEEKPCLDFYINYSRLEEDLGKISKELNFEDNLFNKMKKIKAKGGHRNKKIPAKELYNQELIDTVAKAYAKEIELFNFTPEEVLNKN